MADVKLEKLARYVKVVKGMSKVTANDLVAYDIKDVIGGVEPDKRLFLIFKEWCGRNDRSDAFTAVLDVAQWNNPEILLW